MKLEVQSKANVYWQDPATLDHTLILCSSKTHPVQTLAKETQRDIETTLSNKYMHMPCNNKRGQNLVRSRSICTELATTSNTTSVRTEAAVICVGKHKEV